MIFFVSGPTVSAEGTSLDDAIRQLAERVSAIPNLRGPVRLEIHEDASFNAAQGPGWNETLRHELDKRKLSVTEESGAPLLRVAATETPTQIVLAASVFLADHQEFRVVAIKRAALQAANVPVAPVRIEKQLVFESQERILDAATIEIASSGGLAVLTIRESDLTALRLNAGGAVQQSVGLSAANVRAARDLHAELAIKENEVQLQLSGKTCEFTWSASTDVKCHAAKTAWRSAPELASPCDSSAWELLADGNDWTAGDLLQVVPQGSSLRGVPSLLSDFPGPILSMNAEPSAHSALLVTRNLRTGNYEVYKITLACGN